MVPSLHAQAYDAGNSHIKNSYGAEYYNLDGTNNNLHNPSWGSASTPRIRIAPPLNSYVDGISQPRTEADGLPSARRVLMELFRVAEPHPNKDVSQLLLYFGQFVAHDITRSSESTDVVGDSMPIPCGFGQKAVAEESGGGSGGTGGMVSPHPIPMGALGRCNYAAAAAAAVSCPGMANDEDDSDAEPFIRMQRSTSTSTAAGAQVVARSSSPFDPSSSSTSAAETSINFATSYIDLDHLYGPITGGPPESQVRAFTGGKMILDPQTGLPPKNVTTGQFIFADPQTRLGPSLSVLATVFLRYHNLRADVHAAATPGLSDDELYWLARRDTTAAYQNIVEEKYIPTTLGQTLDPYEGYNPDADPSIDVFFSTVSFRYGHSGLSGFIRLLDANFKPMPEDPLLLRDAFDRTEFVLASGDGDTAAAGVLRGMAAEPAKAADASFVDDVAFFTKQLSTANVQRGRDAGLPSYNDAREWFGLGRARSFEELADGNKDIEKALQDLYSSVDDVDPYVGALLEPSHTVLGPLMTASMKEQFGRLRDGDRFWYKSLLTEDEIAALPSLSEMIKVAFGEDDMKYFPVDSFAAVDQLAVAEGQAPLTDDASLSLLE